jgi:hypothetical protein
MPSREAVYHDGLGGGKPFSRKEPARIARQNFHEENRVLYFAIRSCGMPKKQEKREGSFKNPCHGVQ